MSYGIHDSLFTINRSLFFLAFSVIAEALFENRCDKVINRCMIVGYDDRMFLINKFFHKTFRKNCRSRVLPKFAFNKLIKSVYIKTAVTCKDNKGTNAGFSEMRTDRDEIDVLFSKNFPECFYE